MKKLFVTLTILSVIFITRCQKDNFVEVKGVCPTVVSTNPANEAVDVPINQIITVTFNEKINPATLTQSSFIINGAKPVDGAISYSGTTAFFTPNDILEQNTIYRCKVTTAIKDLTGNALQVDYVWSFTTGTLFAPMVISTNPANNAVNVFPNIITATFNMPMDPLTINTANFLVKQGSSLVSGTVSYSGNVASFTPSSSLVLNASYTCVISKGVKNLSGTALTNDYVWSFSTGANSFPTITSTDPANNATDVALNKIISVNFNVPMDPLTITAKNITIIDGADIIAGLVSLYGNTASLKPINGLKVNTTYTCKVSSAVKDLSGNSLGSDYVWIFSTGGTLAPTITSTDPANNATDVTLNKMIMANFSMRMDPLSLNASSFTLQEGTTLVPGAVLVNGASASFTASSSLKANTLYTCTISKAVRNLIGVSLSNDYIWSFTTGSNVTAPIVLSTDPLNNATSVVLNKIITASFNMPMDPLSINATSFTLKEGTNAVAGSILAAGVNASFTAIAALKANTVYTCTLTKGVRSLAGIPLASDYVWTFTTASDITAPAVLSTDPLNNATSVVLNKIITASFSMPMDPLSINATSFTLKEGTNLVAGSVIGAGVNASFTASLPLKANTVYTCTLTKGVRSLTGIPLVSDYVWTFTTASDITAPVVLSTDPLNNATGVVLNKIITASFSMPIDPLSINATSFTLKEGTNLVAGSVIGAGVNASFTASLPLKANTVYTCTLTKGVKNLLGIPLANDYVWTFTTGSNVAAPSVLSTDPLNNATSVVLNKIITASFNMPMDPLSINATSFTLKEGANVVAGSVLAVGINASFTASLALKANTVYTCTLTKGVKNLLGIPLANDYVWTFTTASAPVVLSTDPINNAVGVLLNKIIVANCSMPMDPLSITPATFVVKEGANVVAGLVTCVGPIASFAAFSALKANTLYSCTLTKGAKNLLGIPLANDYVWTFTTTSISAPEVLSTDPLNNELGVILNKIIVANCSMPMDPLSITPATFVVKEGANVVAGLATCVGSTVSFAAFSALKSNTLYTCTLTKGAKSLSGVPLTNDYVWNFTTKAIVNPSFIDLKTAAQFGILAGVGISSSGLSKINDMDVGLCPGIRSSILGFPPAVVMNGALYAADDVFPLGVLALLTKAKSDLSNAYLFAQGLSSPVPTVISGDQGGKTYVPGIYLCTSSLLVQTGNLILDAQGDANAVWIFQIASGLTTVGGAGGNIILAGGAQAKNVFWVCGNSATLGNGTSFAGNILAFSSITMNSGATAVGRMCAMNGSVLLTNTNIINKP